MGVAVEMAFRVPEAYLSLLIERLKPDIPKAVFVSLSDKTKWSDYLLYLSKKKWLDYDPILESVLILILDCYT